MKAALMPVWWRKSVRVYNRSKGAGDEAPREEGSEGRRGGEGSCSAGDLEGYIPELMRPAKRPPMRNSIICTMLSPSSMRYCKGSCFDGRGQRRASKGKSRSTDLSRRTILLAVVDNLLEDHVEASSTDRPLDLGWSCDRRALEWVLGSFNRAEKRLLLTRKPREEDRGHVGGLFNVVEELEDEVERVAVLGDVATADDAHCEHCWEWIRSARDTLRACNETAPTEDEAVDGIKGVHRALVAELVETGVGVGGDVGKGWCRATRVMSALCVDSVDSARFQ